MPDSFDPYFDWLGIKNGGQPPDHYRLLGLSQFESDPELIGRSADAAMAQVRRIRPGAHLAEWSRLLDRLGQAKNCLLDPPSRQAYDASLTSPPSPAAAEPPPSFFDASLVSSQTGTGEPPPPETPEIEIQTMPEESAAPAIDSYCDEEPAADFAPVVFRPPAVTVSKSGSSGMGLVMAVLLLLAVGAGGLLIHAIGQHERLAANENPVEKPKSQPAKPPAITTKPKPKSAKPQVKKPKPTSEAAKPQAENLAPASEAEKPQAEKPQPEPETEKPTPEQPKPAVDAETAAAFTRAVADARLAFADRDLESAAKHVQVAKDKAQTPEDNQQVDRLQTMLENLSQFWTGIQASMVKLQPTEEIAISDTRLVVVESGRDYLTVKMAGQIRRYKANTLPIALVMALVNQCFGKDPGSKAIIGTFLAVDPNGDRALARQYWQEAAGAGIDSEKLLCELSGSPGGAGGSKNEPPTDKEQLQAAERIVHEKFADKLAKAVSLAGKAELARDLLAAASAESSDVRFVVLREANRLATAGGQPALACEAVDNMARAFNVDVLALKAATLEAGLKTVRGVAGQRNIALAAISLVEQAVEQRRLDEAGRFAAVALEAARKSRNTSLMRQAGAVGQQVKDMQKRNGKS